LSKRRDALRRGIRSLIHDTSRELADLDSRETPRGGANEHGTDAPIDDAPAERAPRPSADAAAGPFGEDVGGPSIDADSDGLLNAEVMAVEVREISRGPAAQPAREPRETADPERHIPESVAEPAEVAAAEPVEAAAQADGPAAPVQQALTIAPPVPGAAPEQPVTLGLAGMSEAAPAGEQDTGTPSRKRPTRAASKKAAKRAGARQAVRMPAGEALDGVDPAQAQSRRGVCVAYFVDHACWHVTNAYCNTALHVCVMRDCPVYHLHRDALEKRFAGKYKHFW